ncbi:TonB-dependent receptor [Halosquirtibacter xylanolyticus]|uniref:TonB-dependent receptor domain-containing protein n=1 Tax=Halosquirtibacter xylanolyticus TaxID=3374599 RepID=UPI003749873A|nr:TonB-dependent receptor [Prolixibacteraceae bacterium]
MRLRILGLLFCLVVITPSYVMAQMILKGSVVTEDNKPLIGATVAEINTTNGVVTDNNGHFTLKTSQSDAQIQISFIGYKKQIFRVSELQKSPMVTMKEDGFNLDEIQVQASISNRRTLRSTPVAVAHIDVEDKLLESGADNLTSVLSGSVEGLQVFQVNGKAGSGTKFNVRSSASFSTMKDPIVIIDGVRMITSNYSDVTSSQDAMSALNDLNMDDVASVEVMKGPSAAASYGAEASNGVIIIQTKKGKTDKMSVTAKVSTVVSKSADDYSYLVNSGPINDFYQTGVGTNANVGISGRTQSDMSYYASINYRDAESFVPGNTDDRLGLRLNLDKKGKWYEWSVTSQYTNGKLSVPLTDGGRYSATWNLMRTVEPWPYLTEDAWNAIDIKYDNDRYIGGAKLKLTPFKDFHVWGNVGYDQNNVFGTNLYPYGYTYGSITKGQKKETNHTTKSMNIEFGADYLWRVNDISNFQFSVVSQTNRYYDRVNSINVQDFPSPGVDGIGTAGKVNGVSENVFEKRIQGYYGEVNYSYDDKLFLGAGIRRDQSNLIGENVASIWYPQVNAAYVWDDMKWADQFKVRGAYGESGRLPNPYDAQSTYIGTQTPTGSAYDYYIKGNPNIKPERTREFELGFDWTKSKQRVAFTSYFQKTTNSIIYTDLPPSEGWPTNQGKYAQNLGEIKGSGIELSYNGTLYQSSSDNLKVDFFANISYQTNEVLSTGGVVQNVWATTIREGLPVYAFYTSSNEATFDPSTGVYTGVSTTDPEYLGKPTPDYTGSFGFNIKMYKDLTLSALFNYALGFQVYNVTQRNIARATNDDGMSLNNYKPRAEAYNNMNQYTPGSSEYIYWANEYAANNGAQRGDFIQDGDFLRLSALTLSYDMTTLVKEKLKTDCFKSARISFTGNNLFLWTKYKGSDPEVDGNGASSYSRSATYTGIDWTTVPRARTFTTTLSLTF